MKKLRRYMNTEAKGLLKLVSDDAEYVFLADALEGEGAEVFSDGETAIICSPSVGAPIWIWCDDGTGIDTILAIGETIKDRFPLERYEIIMDEVLAERLCAADVYFKERHEVREILVCILDVLRLDGYCNGLGRCAVAVYTQIEALAKMWQTAAFEMEGYDFPLEKCRENAEILIDDNRYFVWQDAMGEITSGVTVNYIGKFANIATLYTPKDHRRRGYAMNLICDVSDMLLSEGYTPMLYTYADNLAANECYKKIGFYPTGKLVKITKR